MTSLREGRSSSSDMKPQTWYWGVTECWFPFMSSQFLIISRFIVSSSRLRFKIISTFEMSSLSNLRINGTKTFIKCSVRVSKNSCNNDHWQIDCVIHIVVLCHDYSKFNIFWLILDVASYRFIVSNLLFILLFSSLRCCSVSCKYNFYLGS